MGTQSYLIDTNVVIGLEGNSTVQPAYASFSNLAAKHKVDVFVHEAAQDDIHQDKNIERRKISLSKLAKFQTLEKVPGLQKTVLEQSFGKINKHNDLVDCTLIHALSIGATDFLVTEDQGIHARAQRYSSDLARRVLFVADAAQLIATTYEPNDVPIRHVEEVSAHTIDSANPFFDSLRDGYPEFDTWWKEKCIRERRLCWVVYDDADLAGLVVRKDETASNTDATRTAHKILKICTFKVSPEKRGVKLGELLLKKVLWFAQKNDYDLAYVTAYPDQDVLIALLEYYGFETTATNIRGEIMLERNFSKKRLANISGSNHYEIDRKNYPRFIFDGNTRGFVVPIKEDYHDLLFPDIRNPMQPDFLKDSLFARPGRPGNTIRKVYICRASSNLGKPGSILFFYKGKSKELPSQALTAIGILEEVALANSKRELMRLTGGRSVYSETELIEFNASPSNPLKVINYILIDYIDPAISIDELNDSGIIPGSPPQSISELKGVRLKDTLDRCTFGFHV